MMSITPSPRSYSVAFAPGNGSPWSVVRMTSVSSASPCSSSALSTAPTPWSSDRADPLKPAMSRRVSGVSGRFAGGSEYSASRTDVGSKYSRWVSKNPIERKNGRGGALRSSSTAAGATVSAWWVSMSTTRS